MAGGDAVDGSSLLVDSHVKSFDGHLAHSLHSSYEPGELLQWPRHDDSTINNVLVIIVRIILVLN